MKLFFDLLEGLFFTPLFGDINLYMIVSSLVKFLFVIIVLAFISRIVKMISMDIRASYREVGQEAPFLKLLGDPAHFDFPLRDEYYLTDNTRVGRSDDNNIILKDPAVSKHQAVIVQEGAHFILDDLGSTNPTLVNGQILSQPQPLQDRDMIRFGRIDFIFMEGNRHE